MGWTVLCVSKISPAQVTRNIILELAGYKVIAIANVEEADRLLPEALQRVLNRNAIRAGDRAAKALPLPEYPKKSTT